MGSGEGYCQLPFIHICNALMLSISHFSQGNSSHENGHVQKKVHVKKPLNAFMLYMKEMRSKVISECTLKESAAINQILGKRVSHFLVLDFFYIFRFDYSKISGNFIAKLKCAIKNISKKLYS